MIYQVYSIYDKKLNEFLPPMFCKSEYDALRSCSQLVNFSDSLMNRFPEDYNVQYIGEFDSDDGSFNSFNIFRIYEFNTLVKDETKKYTDILKHIDVESSKLDTKQLLFDEKLNKVDSLIAKVQKKFDDLDSKNVNVPDFLPTNNSIPTKRSILDRLFH